MKKKWLIAVLVCACGVSFAGECKYCGVDTKDCAVFRCNKCRKFFCDKCREGDCKKEDRDPVFGGLQAYQDLGKNITGITVVCPECGNKDKLAMHRFQKGKIRLIKE